MKQIMFDQHDVKVMRIGAEAAGAFFADSMGIGIKPAMWNSAQLDTAAFVSTDEAAIIYEGATGKAVEGEIEAGNVSETVMVKFSAMKFKIGVLRRAYVINVTMSFNELTHWIGSARAADQADAWHQVCDLMKDYKKLPFESLFFDLGDAA